MGIRSRYFFSFYFFFIIFFSFVFSFVKLKISVLVIENIQNVNRYELLMKEQYKSVDPAIDIDLTGPLVQ